MLCVTIFEMEDRRRGLGACLAGYGIAWRSTWEVEAEIASGKLVALLEDFAAPPNGIYAVFPQRKHMALRVRLEIDFLKDNYSQVGFLNN